MTDTDATPEPLSASIYQWALLFNQEGDVLCLQERDSDEWTLPGGPLAADAEIEADEHLVRRVEDDVGLTVRVVTPIHTSTFDEGEETGFGVGYLCEILGDRSTDVSEAYGNRGWLPAKGIDQETLPRGNQFRALQASIAWREWLSD